MSELGMHEATFIWPEVDAEQVILKGSFDKWSSSLHLKKTDRGFEGKIKLPWGEHVQYKFIVDGRWATTKSQPEESDDSGNINNVYLCPLKPTLETKQEESLLTDAAKEVAVTFTRDPDSSPKDVERAPILSDAGSTVMPSKMTPLTESSSVPPLVESSAQPRAESAVRGENGEDVGPVTANSKNATADEGKDVSRTKNDADRNTTEFPPANSTPDWPHRSDTLDQASTLPSTSGASTDSAKFDSVRQKRTSIFGKMKSLFTHGDKSK